MFDKIPVPVKGQPARASWGASITSRVNELCAMSPARGLARDGATGSGFAALPENRRAPRAALLPWTFRCTEDPETHERTGGWYNCQLQIGYSCNIRGSVPPKQGDLITGCDQTEDGSYYVEVDLQNETARIVKSGGGEDGEDEDENEDQSNFRQCGRTCSSDYRNNKILTWIGTVRNGIQTEGIYMIPVIYKFT